MKKLIFALALLIMGGASLSTASAASLSPAVASIIEAGQSDSALQLTGGRHHRYHHKHFRYSGYRHFYYGKGYNWHPYGYYDGYCYEHPYHWWCKKYFFKRY
jgi:hypothetical protein